MLAHYGVDVLDPRVTLRRVKVLAERLPAGSWPDPDSAMSWSTETHMLAQLYDAVAALTYITIRAAGGKPAKPKPFPRPKGPRTARRPPQAASSASPAPSGWAGLARALAGTPGVVIHRG
jgi:hypothetical protein